MSIFTYLKNSFARKIARRVTKEYPTKIETFPTKDYGDIRFANWQNPLVTRKEIDQKYLDFFKKFIKEGDLAIDIGANIGHMTVPMAYICGKKGLTLGFDPNPYVFKILEVNAGLNLENTNLRCFNFAITDAEEMYYYNSSEASFNNGGISKTANNQHGKFTLSQQIQGVKLETFLKKEFPKYLPHLRLIKIDTEGYDKEIIKSIGNLLVEYSPVVISECFKDTTPDDRFEHFELLHSRRYSLFFIEDFNVDTIIIPILKKEDMLNWKHFDFYAIKN
jgi:FkbM family methyltransferase